MSFRKTAKQIEATRIIGGAMHTMLYGGSRSGKTFILVRSIIIRALKCKSRHCILRFRFAHVKQSIIMDTLPKVLKICFPNLPTKLNKTDWFLTLPNGSEIWFGGLDDKERVEKILGNEYSTIYLNECSQISWDAVQVVLTRLAEKTALKSRVFYDCNPPSKKHWTYSVFIDNADPKTKEALKKDNYASLLMNPRDNLDNIADGYITNVLASLNTKQRARFELGLFMSDVDGALWTCDMIDTAKAREALLPLRTVVAIDPSISNNPDSDLAGIVVASKCGNDSYRVQCDNSLRASPDTWAQAAINSYNEYSADAIVVETNQGGEMAKTILRQKGFRGSIIEVHASRGKFARAEPISALYEQGLVSHDKGLDELEAELTEYAPMTAKKSPDRLDALVWALTELSCKQQQLKIRRL